MVLEMSYRGPLVTVLENTHLAQFSVNDCSVGGDWKMEIPMYSMMVMDSEVRAVLGFPMCRAFSPPQLLFSGQDPRLWVTKSLLLPHVTICTSGILFSPSYSDHLQLHLQPCCVQSFLPFVANTKSSP